MPCSCDGEQNALDNWEKNPQKNYDGSTCYAISQHCGISNVYVLDLGLQLTVFVFTVLQK